MSSMNFMEKLLDGVAVEWGALEDLTIDKFWIMPATPKFNENEKIPYITSKNIRGGNIYFEKIKFISHSDYLNLSRNRPILAGDILISMIGTIGEVARVKDTDLDFYGQNMYLIRLNESLINSDYFLHFFDSPGMKNHFNSVKNNSGQGYLKANDIEKLQIPIPCPENPKKSLEIQAEIVRILDAFTDLTTDLTTELTAEVAARKKQYNHYRDQLLSFEEGEVEWKTLGEVVRTITTGKLNANAMVENGKYPFFTCDANPFKIDTYAFDTEAIIVSGNGSQVGHINYYSGKFNAYQRTYILADCNNEVSMRYLLTYLKAYLRPYIIQNSKKGSVPYITMPMLQNFAVPIPSPAEQTRISAILDKFDMLTDSISEGLPREIALRQKQYEYYRDLLLSFPKPEEVAA